MNQEQKYNSQDILSSPFYKLHSIKYLCKFLHIKERELHDVIQTRDEALAEEVPNFEDNNWREIKRYTNKILVKSIRQNKKNPNKQPRIFLYPKSNSKLHKIYKEILIKLDRVKKPNYLFSCKKGSSHVMSAKYHSGCNSLVTIDIKSFFPSVKKSHVENFFHNTMKCNTKISKLLSNLMTYEDQLNQGACFSPVLSWLCFKKMFDSIDQEARQQEIKFSLWIDDIAISGKGSHKFIKNIKDRFQSNGLKVKWAKLKTYKHKSEKKDIMGIQLKNENIFTKESAHKGYKKYVERVNQT
jgi:hypothetical protein